MSISAKDVAELRKQTGAGMMDCKKALIETDGDFQAATELLRKKGQKVSDSRSGRDAKEGSIFARTNTDNSQAIMIELNCETDFVARNDDFQGLGNSILELAENNKPADLDSLKGLSMNGGSIEDELTNAMGRIGEKIDIRHFEVIQGERVITYIHPGARVGVAVAFEGVGEVDIDQVGKDIAMQIAAMHPVAIDKDDVSEEIIETERRIGREQAIAEGKPENIIDKIAEGKLNKYFKMNTLLNQEFVKDSSKTVAGFLKEHNPDLKVKAFKRLQLGQ